MVTIELTDRLYWENLDCEDSNCKNIADGYVIFLNEAFEPSVDISRIEQEFYPHVMSILKKHKFKGKVGESFALTAPKGDKLVHLVFVGLGKQDGEWPRELEHLRRAIGGAVSKLKSLEVETAVLQLPKGKIFGVEEPELIKQIAIITHMADYKFTTFKRQKDKDLRDWKLSITIDGEIDDALTKALETGLIIGKAVNESRLICDLPPNVATPTYVSEHAKKLASDIMGLKCAIFGVDKAKELGMGGFLAVDAGSEEPGKFVVLEYDCEKKDAPTIALVGKGVTFDSGGISLKPANFMTGMKFDMSGAAAVIGAMQIIAQLKPEVHVIGLTPLVENMPSGRANRQDDIVTFMNGKTAEIINTDAEGRLILADALCYAEKFYSPDVLIDVATLTGACVHALGHYFSGLMTKDIKLSSLLRASADLTGDRLWPLPLDDDYVPAIKSEVADIANCGAPTYKAGTITAGHFLSNFVEKASWAHIDIAGTADGVSGINYLGKGATGAGIRLMVDFVIDYVDSHV